MSNDQKSLFDTRKFRGEKQQNIEVKMPTEDSTVMASLGAYHMYLSSGKYSKYTPDDFTADVKRFAIFIGPKPLVHIDASDLHQWVAQLRKTMPPKTLSRKVSAVGNYFRWLKAEHVISENPAFGIRAPRVVAPLPDILFDNECDKLLAAASSDPRTYLLVLLLLETGIKKSELQDLKIGDFDFSNKYQPELWVKHSEKHVFKDRRLRLPREITDVFNDYIEQYKITDVLFPYTPRTLEQVLAQAKSDAKISKPVTASILRDMFVIRCVKRGGRLEEAFEKIGLSKSSYDDARKKYGRLTAEAL